MTHPQVTSPPAHHPAVAHELARAQEAELHVNTDLTRIIERPVREIHATTVPVDPIP